MSADVFGEWHRLRGQRVFKTATSHWHTERGRALQAFPYQRLIAPSREELSELITRERVSAVRFSTSAATPAGYPSYHVVYEQDEYGFDALGKWARQNVRKGLKRCFVEPISFERMADEGWELHVDTLDRQHRTAVIPREKWRRLWLATADLPGFMAWGAFADGRLAASVVSALVDDYHCLLFQQSRREHLRSYVNNALTFEVSKFLTASRASHGIFYSLHSLDAAEGMDEFKFRMGYDRKAVRQQVVLHPWLSPLVRPLSWRVVRAVQRLRPSDPVLAKAEGMMRFYLSGQTDH